MRTIYAVLILSACLPASAQPSTLPALKQTISLQGVSGKFDHFAVDIKDHRLFVAATGNHSVEVINLATGKVDQSITGFGKPHGLAWVASTGSLYVSDGSLRELRVYRGSPLALAGTIKLSDDADDMVYDEADRLLFVGHGGSDSANPAEVAVVDTERFKLLNNVAVATHPEALEIDPSTKRIFANIADSGEVSVIDAATKAVSGHWKLTSAGDNVPLAFDRARQLLYIACRTPGTLIAVDTKTGQEVAAVPTAGGADDLFFDAALSRVYVISGAGEVDSYQVDDARKIHSLGVLHTAPGAKTALLVPSQGLLYVGVPGANGKPSEIRVYSTGSTGSEL